MQAAEAEQENVLAYQKTPGDCSQQCGSLVLRVVFIQTARFY